MTKDFCILTLIVLLFASCTSSNKTESNVYEEEAQHISDSIKNVDTLLMYANKYANINEKRAEIIIRINIGKQYRDHCEFDKAIAQHDSTITLAKSINDTLHWIKALNQQGTNFRRLGDMDEASRLHYEALSLTDEQVNDTSFESRKNRVVTLNGLGNVLLSMANYEESERMFRLALAGEQYLGSNLGQAINYANIGSIFEHKNQLDSARVYYKMSMNKNREANNATGIGLCYKYLGQLDEKEGNLEAARENYHTSYEISLPTGDAWHWLEASSDLARLYLMTSKADSARKYVDITLKTANEIGSKEHQATAYRLRSEYEEKWGNAKEALTLYKLSKELNDSVLSEKNYNHMQNLRVNYEAKRRSAEVEQARNEAKVEQTIRHIITWVGFAIFLVMCGVVFALSYIVRVSRRSNATLQRANEAMKQADEDLRKADAELRQADEELRQADRERQAFYRDIAHRFRTPLTVVIGMTQQLREHINKEDEQAQGDFKAVERQNGELLRLVNEMMHKLQPNATTATVTAIDGELQVGNISENFETIDTDNTYAITSETQQTEAMPNADGSKPLILLAEDNPDVARYQCELLERNGYRVNWAEDGLMALELLKEEMPKLVITDVMMPHMNGLELCKNIRNEASTAHLPLIIVTARVEDRDRMKGLEAGAEVYLTKPFLGKELLLNIKNLLDQREKLRMKYTETASDHTNPESTTDENSSTNFQKMLNEVIDLNLSNSEFNSTILAANLCLSRSQLNRKINEELGIDTSRYIRERRMSHACDMLKSPNYSIMDVQIACGFESPAYFSRAFKQRFDMTPTEYRNTSLKK